MVGDAWEDVLLYESMLLLAESFTQTHTNLTNLKEQNIHISNVDLHEVDIMNNTTTT